MKPSRPVDVITRHRHLPNAACGKLDDYPQKHSHPEERVIHDEHSDLNKITPHPDHIPQTKEGAKEGPKTSNLPRQAESQPKTPLSPTSHILFPPSPQTIGLNQSKFTSEPRLSGKNKKGTFNTLISRV